MQYVAGFGDLDHLTWNLPGITNYLQHGFHFAWFRPRSVAKQQFYWKKICREVYFLEFWVSKFSSLRRIKKELGARWCKMFHINRPLSPNSRWKLRFFQNLQGEWKFRKGTCPLKSLWEQKTITFTQVHPCWNRRLGFPSSSPKLWFLLFLAQNCGSKGGPLSETQK